MTASERIKSLAWERLLSQPINREPQPMKITLKLIWEMLPAIWRIRRWTREQCKKGRRPLFDLVMGGYPVVPDKGVSLGGLGGGTITRGCQGDFNRWAVKPGDYEYRKVDADQFSLWVSRVGEEHEALVLNPDPPEGDDLKRWGWGKLGEEKVTYRALFPRAWHDYQEPIPGINLSCRQVSPVIPHNYKESSFPVSAFVWTIENTGEEDMDAALMFTFQNGTGGENDLAGGHSNHLIEETSEQGQIVGVELCHIHRHPIPLEEGQKLADQESYEDQLAFGIGALASDGVDVSYHTRFLTDSDGGDLWGDFTHDGRLANQVEERPSPLGHAVGGAVSARVHVPAGESRDIVFALVWDMPITRFPDGTGWYRRYTKFYGREGEAVAALLQNALTQYLKWEAAIDEWQRPILEDDALPSWYRQMLFNETYYLVDGGTLWTDGRVGAVDTSEDPLPEPDIGHFAYLESHEYRMYNTYDVHFYSSFALAMLWPELELSLQRDYAHSLLIENDQIITYFFSGDKGPRKVRGVIPHDLGSPLEDPWIKINAYNAQDISRWKDLNPKFVLQIARDYFLTEDKSFLEAVWPAVHEAIQYMFQFDKDGDGMIENEGFPDQTYDVWSAKGPSAYCGGLWLACLQAGAALAEEMGEIDLANFYQAQFQKAQQVYEDVLWNGEYYDYEASGSKHQDSIMADQLAGHWYSLACGLGGVVPGDHARSALQKVFDFNIMGYEEGRLGAVNGMRPDGGLDKTGMQSMEIWTGTTFAVAAAMLQAGMEDQAFKTAKGIYHMVYEDYGLWFQTPEALSIDESARAIAYMRPLAIWAIQWELEGMKE
ncbi:MAG: non-lysosomal glucosylceramidase [Chloroflexota bacterium]|nr:non-lysosomal glucosylceramidase [Chloroflexota bacterium]